MAPLGLRYAFPAVMEALLQVRDFIVLGRYRDDDFRPLNAESPHQLSVCQLA